LFLLDHLFFCLDGQYGEVTTLAGNELVQKSFISFFEFIFFFNFRGGGHDPTHPGVVNAQNIYTFGQFMGRRYKDRSNIIWV